MLRYRLILWIRITGDGIGRVDIDIGRNFVAVEFDIVILRELVKNGVRVWRTLVCSCEVPSTLCLRLWLELFIPLLGSIFGRKN